MSGAKAIKVARRLQRPVKATRNLKLREVRRSGIRPIDKIGRESKPRFCGAFLWVVQ